MRLAEFIALLAILSGLGMIGLAGLVVIFQFLLWLVNGKWTPITINDALGKLDIVIPTASWGGVQIIINYIADTSLSAGMFYGALAIMLIGFTVEGLPKKK